MKNKGLVIFITVILTLTCIYELSFTWKTRGFEEKARAFASKGGKYSPERYRDYIDSLGNKTLLDLGFVKKSYFQCKDAELKLGLDLQGGMNVTLEVSKGEVIKSLANKTSKEDAAFKNAISNAQAQYQKSGGDFIDLFSKYFKEAAPTRSLASVFTGSNSSKRITINSSDAEIISYLKDEMASKAENTRQVIESRLNSGNISQPNIQQLENGRISVELPGVDNPTRIRNLLEQSARLEFWEVYGNNPQSGFQAYKKIYTPMSIAYAQKLRLSKSDPKEDSIKRAEIAAIADSTKRDSAMLAYKKSTTDKDSSNDALAKLGLVPYTDNKGTIVENAYLGIADKSSINKINKVLDDQFIKNALPKNVRFAWSAKPIQKETNVFALYALKANGDGNASMGSGDENMIADAVATTSQTSSEREVTMAMTTSASNQWRNLTKVAAQTKDFIAIVLDNKVYSAPTVNQEISGGNSSITGGFDAQEANDLANTLKAGKLPAPAQIIAEDVVGPTLGKESIQSGMYSLIAGFIAVIILMVVYYKRGGIIATLAVLLNVFFIVGILASYGTALTLPGIAGIVLTIGMAVDANVLIYERIKEELRLGKSMKAAVTGGFSAAFSSIIDGNLTTLIAGIIMTFVGAGPVYGFAIVLIIGIITSLFTSIFITRILIERRTEKGLDVSFFNKYSKDLMIGSNFNFIGNRKKSYLFSTAIIVIGMTVLILRGGLSTGIDFKGGYGYEIQMASGVKPAEIRAQLDKALVNSSNEVKTIGNAGRFKITTTYRINETKVSADSVSNDLLKALAPYKTTKADILSSAKVGPTIASNIRTRSAWVIFFSVIAIFIYIVIRFKNISFAVGAIIALIHDVLMVFAIFVLLEPIVPFALEMDQNFIGAILTIVGYSINDSVVIFDRIRENLTEFKSETNRAKIINDSINQTLSRTIMTSATVLVVVIILFLFGGVALKGFSLAMLIGVFMGSYSTIFIAAPIVVDLFKNKSVKY